jgi:hypothetical protein
MPAAVTAGAFLGLSLEFETRRAPSLRISAEHRSRTYTASPPLRQARPKLPVRHFLRRGNAVAV